MISKEEFLDRIYEEVSPLVEKRAGEAKDDVLEGYRDYLDKRYEKTYHKVTAKLDALVSSAVHKIAVNEEVNIAKMDFDAMVEEICAARAEEERLEAERIAAESAATEEDVSDVIDEFLIDDSEENPPHEEERDLSVDDFSSAFEIQDDIPDAMATLPKIAFPDPEHNPFAGTVDDVFDDDSHLDLESFSPSNEISVDSQPQYDTFNATEYSFEAAFENFEILEDDELEPYYDGDVGDNGSIPSSALYGIVDNGFIDENVGDPALNWIITTSNEVFRHAMAVIDGAARTNNDAELDSLTDSLHNAVADVLPENRELADTLAQETAQDLMLVYGKSDNFSIRSQLYASRSLPLETRKAEMATRISQETARSLLVSVQDKFVGEDPKAVEDMCSRYATAKVNEIFKRITEQNMDVLDDVRKMLMNKEPERFSDKGAGYIRKYMEAYAAKHG